MAKALLFVESKPATPEQVDEYHAGTRALTFPRCSASTDSSRPVAGRPTTATPSSRSTRSTPTSTPPGQPQGRVAVRADVQTGCGAAGTAARSALPDTRQRSHRVIDRERPLRLTPLPDAEWDDRCREALSSLIPAERANAHGAGNVLATLVRHPDLTAGLSAVQRVPAAELDAVGRESGRSGCCV